MHPVSPINLSDRIISGRPYLHNYGGVGIMWRKNPGMKCEAITYDNNRIWGLDVMDVKYNNYTM